MSGAAVLADDIVFSLAALRAGYLAGKFTPAEVLATAKQRIARDAGNPVWIALADDAALARELARLRTLDPATHPLWGIPFAVKDNIDVAGMATTAACPAFARMADADAPVVAALRAAGAIALGKTNLDQFATGLVGTRSPYGEVQNAVLPEYISGGSSSGSAVALARGHVAFALGTDTAGSGRVPAALNGLVGVKPSRGLLSTRGVVPACRSLDCVSLFAIDLADAAIVLPLLRGYDALDPYARALTLDASLPPALKIGVPRPGQLEFFGNAESAALFAAAVEQAHAVGAKIIEIDFQPFIDAAQLLYAGPWVAERYLVAKPLLESQSDALLPVTRAIIGGGAALRADDAFAAMYRLQSLRRQAEQVLATVDAVLTPTIGTPFTRAQVAAEPVLRNSELGYYTNFMNLLDLAATAVPAGFQHDGLPFGVTLAAPPHQDGPLLHLASRMQQALGGKLGATAHALPVAEALDLLPSGQVRIAVVGAHLDGLPLNHQLTERNARLVSATQTAPRYRFYALPDGRRPGLIRVQDGGAPIACEVWEMPAEKFGSFVAAIPAPLGIGKLELADGSAVNGFICEEVAVADAQDITEYGGWRAWLAARGAAPI